MSSSPIRKVMVRVALAAAALLPPLAAATQWDLSEGDYHTHLMTTDKGFQLFLHDRATHTSVDTARGKVVATVLAGGKRETVPLTQKAVGLLESARPLSGDWTLLVRLDVPGRKPAQLRYSSRMKSGSQDAAKQDATKQVDGKKAPAHDHKHEH